jgi:hypothetical protein
MPSALIGGAISGVGSLVGGILGSNAANKAAQQQAAADKAAANNEQQAIGTATAAQNTATTAQTANAQPFISTGQGASNNLASLIAPGGQLTQNYAGQYGQFTAPTAAQAQQTPGYQFELQQGLNSLQNSAAARGGLLSSGTAKNLLGYAEGTAASNYQNTYNNALNAYNENFGVYNTSQNNLFNWNYAPSVLGASSASSLNSTLQSGANNLANINLGGAQQYGQDIMGQGAAQAAGTVGSTNALTAGIGGALNTVGQGVTLSGLQNGGFGGGFGATPPIFGGGGAPISPYNIPGYTATNTGGSNNLAGAY